MKKQEIAWAGIVAGFFACQYGFLLTSGVALDGLPIQEFSLSSFVGSVLVMGIFYVVLWCIMCTVTVIVSFFVEDKKTDFTWDTVNTIKTCCWISFILVIGVSLGRRVIWMIQA